MSKTNVCRACDDPLTDANWYPSSRLNNNYMCKGCLRERKQGYTIGKTYKRKPRLMSENRQCTLFLGVHVAERVLSKVFKNVERMPHKNPGYDFICNRGKKIDVKSSCLNKDKRWKFKIRHNNTPDFFLVIAFNNRRKLDPKYVWLIPKNDVCHVHSISIAPSTIGKWDNYRLNIDSVIACCKTMKS